MFAPDFPNCCYWNVLPWSHVERQPGGLVAQPQAWLPWDTSLQRLPSPQVAVDTRGGSGAGGWGWLGFRELRRHLPGEGPGAPRSPQVMLQPCSPVSAPPLSQPRSPFHPFHTVRARHNPELGPTSLRSLWATPGSRGTALLPQKTPRGSPACDVHRRADPQCCPNGTKDWRGTPFAGDTKPGAIGQGQAAQGPQPTLSLPQQLPLHLAQESRRCFVQ